MIKILSWIIALLGLWEFGDIAAIFVPDFGRIPLFVWNHILVGLILMIVGVWSARTGKPRIAKSLKWIAVAAGAWLAVGSFLLRYPVIDIGLWNDVIVGVLVFIFGLWVILRSTQGAG
jgi:hypothetical protein